MAYVMEEEKDRTIPEDTIVRVVLEDVNEDKTINWKDKTTGEAKSADMIEWWFKVIDERDDGLYVGRKVKYECDARLTNHPANGFRLVAEALIGRELEIGTPVDPSDDLVGLKCDITVRHRPYTDAKGNDRIAEDVDELIALSDDDVPF